ncbi:MAG: translation elongation factor Ts [Erysipelotrichaceae bacterium]|nr:translation elongation factor Ts [Erysipelotrichaceae bacterium]
MAISAAQVKELREKTGAGMLDCKNALVASDGDMEKAIDWLREKGIAKSVKKASRIAAEGLAKIVINGNKACMIEVNSETDFVAKNEQFLKLLETAANTILANDPADNDAALALACGNGTLNDEFINATATIGEKIVLRRFVIVSKEDDELFGDYTHMGGSKTALVVLKGGNEELAHYMAMQIASMSPAYVSSADMPADVVDHERKVQTEIVRNDEKFAGKPENVINGAIEGKVSKALKEMCLVDQEYFLDTSKKVAAVLKENHAEVKCFVRYTVGEGIEKREENFADEVAKQMNA